MMRVLDSKPGQTLVIGEDIIVTLVAVQGGRVTLGIQAPRSCHIVRGELTPLPDEPLIVEVCESGESRNDLLPFERM